MKTKMVWIALLLVLLAPAVYAQEVVREYSASVALDVDGNGQVSQATMPANIPTLLVKPAQALLRRWRFKPVQRHGHAVTARTYANVRLQVLQQAQGKYRLRAIYHGNGPVLDWTEFPPYMPRQRRSRSEARLLMTAVVRADGSLSDIALVKGVFRGPDHGAFVRNTIASMKKIHAKPEWVDAHPVATRIQTPIEFRLEGVSRLPKREPWFNQTAQAPDASGPQWVPVGQAIAMDSPLQPLSVPAGG